MKTPTAKQLRAENADLRARLDEAEQTLDAIRAGEVDAVVVSGPKGEQIFSLVGAESIYRLIVETMKEAAFTVAFDGTILFCNSQFGQFVQRPMEQIVGHRLHEFVAPDNLTSADSLLMLSGKQPVKQRLVLRNSQEQPVPVHISANALNLPDGSSICIVATDLTELENSTDLIQQLRRQQEALRDSRIAALNLMKDAVETRLQTEQANEKLRQEVTDRQRAEESLRQSQAMLSEAEKIANIGSWEWDVRSGELTWSEQTYRIFGVDSGQFVPNYEAFLACIHLEDRQRVVQAIEDLLSSGRRYDIEYRIVVPDSSTRWIHARGDVVSQESGRPIRMIGTVLDITERKRMEEEARRLADAVAREKDRLVALVNSIADEIWFADAAGEFTLVNPSAVQEFALDTAKPTDVRGLAERLEVLRPDGSPRPVEEAPPLRAIRGEVVRNQEEIIRTPASGELRYRQVSSSPVRDAGGHIIGSVSVVRDITERKRAEEAVSRSQKTFYELVERSPFGIYVVDSQFRIAHMNAASQTGAFQNVRPVIGRDFAEAMRILWPEDVAAGIIAAFRHTLDTGEPYYSPRFINPRHDVGVVESYEWELHRMTLPDGQNGVICYYFDSTKLREAEAALRESEFHLARAQEIAHLGSWAWDIVEDRLYWSDETYRLFGLEPGEFVSRPKDFFGFVHPDDHHRVEQSLQEALAHRPYNLDFRIVQKGGEQRYVHGEGQTTFDPEGHPVKMEGTVQDITDRKRAEEALRKSEERFRALVTASSDVLYQMSPDWSEMRQLHSQGFLAKTETPNRIWLEEYIPPDDQPHVTAVIQEAIRTKGNFELEHRVRRADGSLGWTFSRAVPLLDANGEIVEWFGSARDITERKHAEEALRGLNATLESKVTERTAELQHRARQLQKLTLELSETEDHERRQLAEILHDDLQQQLAAAKFHLSLLNSRAKHDPSQLGIVTQVDQMLMDAIQKSRNLSHELSPAVLYQGDFTGALGWLAGQLQAKHGLEVAVDAFGEVRVQSDALKSFLYKSAQELLFNVVKHARTNQARIRVRRLARCICLSVSDRGRGFDPQELHQTPGFGLLSIRERIELLGGRMKIQSVKGQGSKFHIVVPDSPMTEDGGKKTAGGLASSVLRPPSSSRVLRVLLADDHEIVREGLRSLLSEAGDIEVVGEAANGREAVDQAYRVQPDVIIMDVAMPLINGNDATRQIKKHLPKTRVIALSMYEAPDLVEKMRRAGAEGYILKTAPAKELLAAIRGKPTPS